MSNFSAAFYGMVDGSDIAMKEERIRRNMELMNLSAEDAVFMDNALLAACRSVNRLVGNAIDRLPARIHHGALRSFAATAAANLEQTATLVSALLAGVPLELLGEEPTPDCECYACKTKKLLIDEVQQVRVSRLRQTQSDEGMQ